jgi:serine phosphatase RsbU (regulator of sigma subunit)
MLVADVSGHGSAVADLAVRLRDLMRRFMNYVDQSRLMEGINREFAGLTDSGRFATAMAATFWAPTREIEVSNAGHPPPILYAAKTGKWSPLHAAKSPAATGDDLPLGILDASTYGRFKTTLGPGDTLVMYTDGFIEARSAAGEFLGEGGLVEALASLDMSDPSSLAPRAYERARAFAGGALDDDATILVLRLNDLAVPRGSLRLGARVSAEIAVDYVRQFLPGGKRFLLPEFRKDNILGAVFDRFNKRPGNGE